MGNLNNLQDCLGSPLHHLAIISFLLYCFYANGYLLEGRISTFPALPAPYIVDIIIIFRSETSSTHRKLKIWKTVKRNIWFNGISSWRRRRVSWAAWRPTRWTWPSWTSWPSPSAAWPSSPGTSTTPRSRSRWGNSRHLFKKKDFFFTEILALIAWNVLYWGNVVFWESAPP